ncbi:umecyanin [Artemisia annua]|uniref:Umecyanin n=1 Tax=Artemisia annua TaxID=35608 RepID=A0A2U1MB95_ARTAN|nr:umecyanin [Artemisia annua]
MEGFKLIIVMVTVVACLQFHGLVEADDIVVGGVKGTWTLQQNPKFYQEWSRDHSGFMRPKLDTLVFNFENGKHTVAKVGSFVEFDSCNTTKPIRVWTTSPAR